MNRYVLTAIRRRKDNPELSGKEMFFRHVVKNFDKDVEIMKNKASLMGDGVWRIYQSVNLRDLEKARNSLLHKMIDDPGKVLIDSMWKTELMQPTNKAENLWLLDVDTLDFSELEHLTYCMDDMNVVIKNEIRTPNGYHIVTERFNTTKHDLGSNVAIMKDAQLFIDQFEVLEGEIRDKI